MHRLADVKFEVGVGALDAMRLSIQMLVMLLFFLAKSFRAGPGRPLPAESAKTCGIQGAGCGQGCCVRGGLDGS